MVKFLISTFTVNFVKDNGLFLSITGIPADRSSPMKLKMYMRPEMQHEMFERLLTPEREIDVVITGKRKQSDFERANNIEYYDFCLLRDCY